MSSERQHEVIRDATLTFAHVLKTQLPGRLENRPVDVYFEPPGQADLEKAWGENRVPLTCILVDIHRATGRQVMEEPIVREEDEDGNIVEYRLGIPTFVMPRYMITPWCKDALDGQVVHGTILQLFFDYRNFAPEDVQGVSIHGEDRCPIEFDDGFELDAQIKMWQALARPFRASLLYRTTLRIDSVKKTLVRRVKERVLDYKKLQG
jgi:hypothetical protein